MMRLLHRTMALGVACCAQLATHAQSDFNAKALFSPMQKSFNEFGFRLAAADLNADSFDDLVVSEPLAEVAGVTTAGRVWIFFGPDFAKSREIRIGTPLQGEELGLGGLEAGDANDDGILDVLVLSPKADESGVSDVGTAHLALGPEFNQAIELEFNAPHPGTQFGSAGAILGNACSSADLLVGAPLVSRNMFSAAGEVALYDVPSPDPVAIIATPAQDQGYFGSHIATADMDDDGNSEVLVSAHFVSSPTGGQGVVYIMKPCGDIVEQVVLPPVIPGMPISSFGRSVEVDELAGGVGPDMLVGAPATNVGDLNDAGAFVLLEGPLFSNLVRTFVSPAASSDGAFGFWSAVADFSHDGIADIALGDPYAKPAALHAARVYVYLGPDYSDEMVVSDPLSSFVEFGEGVTAADIDGDGYAELICRSALADASGVVHVFDPVNLVPSLSSISLSQGGDISLQLGLGPKHAGKDYLIVLGVSGSDPGVVAGPGSYVRLNVDSITWAGLSLLRSAVLEDFIGTLDAQGSANAVIHWPPGLGKPLAGQTLTLAAVAIEQGRPDAGSSAASVSLTP